MCFQVGTNLQTTPPQINTKAQLGIIMGNPGAPTWLAKSIYHFLIEMQKEESCERFVQFF